MRILQLIQKPQLRGAEIFACQLSLELITLGHQVDIIYLFDQTNNLEEFNLKFKALHAIQNRRFWDFSAYKRLSNLIKEGNYDIVQANAGDTLKYAVFSKILFRWKAKLIFRNANKMSAFIHNPFQAAFNKFLLSNVNYVISVSENCKEDIIDFYPSVIDKTTTGTIGTYDFDQIEPIHHSKDKFIWINVGSFVKEKNHLFLIELFSKFKEKHTNSELWLIGDGKLRKTLEQYSCKLGLENSIKFFGYRNDVIGLIKSSTVMVMPSKIEGMPGVILEALSCGIPVIASNVGGIPEVVIDGVNGYIIEDFNHDNYINHIEKLAYNSELYSKFSNNGKHIIQDKYLLSNVAKNFERIYESVVDII